MGGQQRCGCRLQNDRFLVRCSFKHWTTPSPGQCLEEGYYCLDDSYNPGGSIVCCEGTFCIPDNWGGAYCQSDSWGQSTTTTTTELPCVASGEKCWDGTNGGLIGSGNCCSTNSYCIVDGGPFSDYYCP